MFKLKKSHIPILLILLLSLLFVKLHANKRSSRKDVCFTISGDARGYYAWLPAIFIYHDLNFHFFDTVETKDTTCACTSCNSIQDYRNSFKEGSCNKYYPGSSLMMLPFFTVAHLITKYCSPYPPNGYSYYYFKIMGFTGAFYYLIGILFLLKIFERLQLSLLQRSLAILLVTFGSNLIYYIIDAPLYSHIYSFALTSAFLHYLFRLKDNTTAQNIAYLSFITGLIFITRPVNVSILILVPFVFGKDLKMLWHTIMARPSILFGMLPVLVMPVILFTLYKISLGHFFVYSYNKEGFDFLHPHFWQFLFHYDNGVFLYMPLLLMPFLFLAAWYRPEHKYIILGIATTLLVTFYIHSSWYWWSYSFSFGARTILDFVPVFGIAIALSLKYTNLKKHFYLLPLYFICCAFTLLLYQQKSVNHFMGVYPITDFWTAIYSAFGMK